MQQITPFLWYDNNAEEAANLYVSIFKNSSIKGSSRYTAESGKASGQKEGAVMTISFNLNGLDFTAINGGPMFKFTEAISFSVHCDDQAEIDDYWKKLTENGGQESQCGWLKDKFGLSWQIIPKELPELIGNKDAGKAQRAMHAMLQMKKIDIQKMKDAAENRS